MAMGVTVWDPQNGRIVSAGPTSPTKTHRTKLRHQIDRIVRGMGCRNAPERSGTLGPKWPPNRPNCEWNGRPERSGTPDDPQTALMRPSLFLEGPNGYGGWG